MLFDPPEKVYRDRNNEPKGEQRANIKVLTPFGEDGKKKWKGL